MSNILQKPIPVSILVIVYLTDIQSSTPYYRPQRSWGKVIFSEVCVNNSVHRGGGMRGCTGGTAACMVALGGGCVHGFIWGACMVLFGGCAWFYSGGHAWFYSGGHVWFYLGGHVWFYSGGCMVLFGGGMCGFIQGACMVLFGGHAWFYSGACMVLFSGGGHAWFFQFFRIQ